MMQYINEIYQCEQREEGDLMRARNLKYIMVFCMHKG